MTVRVPAAPPRVSAGWLVGGGLASTAGAVCALVLRGPRALVFTVRLSEASTPLVHRPVGDAVLAVAVVVGAVVAILCGHRVVRSRLLDTAPAGAGWVGAVEWALGLVLLTLAGPTLLHVLTDVIAGFAVAP